MQSKDRLSWIVGKPWFLGTVAGLVAVASLKSPPLVHLSGPAIALLALGGSLSSLALGVLLGLGLLALGWIILGQGAVVEGASVLLVWLLYLVLAGVFRRKESLNLPLQIVAALMSLQVLAGNLLGPELSSFFSLGFGSGHDYRLALSSLKAIENTAPRLLSGFTTVLMGFALFGGFLFSIWARELLGASFQLSQLFAKISFSRWTVFFAIFMIWLGGLVNLDLLENLMMVWIAVYAIVGFAVLDGVIQVRRLPRLWLLLAVLLLLLAPPEILVTLALVGAVDAFVHFRIQGDNR